jgi:glycosyltransferase involved in cell wall biosynthesis
MTPAVTAHHATRPLHVVHLVSGDQWAGAEVMTWLLLSELASRADQCRVSAVALNDGELVRRLRASNVNVHVFDERRLSFLEILRSTLALVRSAGADVLHSHRYKEHWLAAGLAAVTKSRTVATVHGMPEPARTVRLRYAAQTWATFRLLTYRFDGVAAVSEATRQRLVVDHHLRSAQVHIVPNGIRVPADPARAPKTESPHIGSVGRLVAVKRFELFLETAAIVRRQYPTARFSILGDGPDREMLVSRAAAMGLGGCFRVLDPVLDPWSYYRSLDVYVNTSASEGLPLSVLEAMSIGVPAVASAVGGIPEVVRQGLDGVLVYSSQASDYAAACAGLLSDGARREQLGNRARERVLSEYSAATMATRYIDLYHQLLSAAAPNGVPLYADPQRERS